MTSLGQISLDDFSGEARLFPLPNIVMFPNVIQPLHIFEPRYRAMTAEALATDKLIAMSWLVPGWEKDYDDQPRIAPMVCLGRIVTHTELPDGCYNLLLLGLQRAEIIRELPMKDDFRRAELQLVPDRYPVSEQAERPAVQRQLLDQFRRTMPKSTDMEQELAQLLSRQAPLGALTDIIAFTADLSLAQKQELLEESDVDLRAKFLLSHLKEQIGETSEASETPDRKFPPEFSVN